MEGKLSKRARPEKEEEMNVKQRKLDSWCRPRSETPAAVATPSRAGSWMLEELPDAASLRLKGTMRMDVRSKRKEEVVVIPDSDEERETVPKRSTKGILRVSAGRAAAVAGIHCYADVGEVFLELLYQDQPELLLADAQLAGVEVVSPQLERARLVEKSGEATGLEAALKAAQEAQNVEAAEGARSQLRDLVAKAKADGRITAEEAAELQQTLELEVNLDFGARHEDSAIERYEKKVGSKVYGQQQRLCLGFALFKDLLCFQPKSTVHGDLVASSWWSACLWPRKPQGMRQRALLWIHQLRLRGLTAATHAWHSQTHESRQAGLSSRCCRRAFKLLQAFFMFEACGCLGPLYVLWLHLSSHSCAPLLQ
ncbi:unnamed protein product [Durusdinium trenchii]|uniref:Uncharacterized protein n=1 Tax=Durusdinium trenchii TaxID=1381693 RepID=A0ABP0PM85_9DINO